MPPSSGPAGFAVFFDGLLCLGGILAALAASGQERTRWQALRYLRRWRSLKPALDGHALLAMGAKPGPRLGEVLRHLKAAKLDSEVRSRGDEERMARRLLGLSSDRRE